MTDRISCCVPFCRRTRANPGFTEWICGKHWTSLPKDRRRVYGRLKGRWRRFGGPEAQDRANRVWDRLKRQAIELAVGIG